MIFYESTINFGRCPDIQKCSLDVIFMYLFLLKILLLLGVSVPPIEPKKGEGTMKFTPFLPLTQMMPHSSFGDNWSCSF